MFQRNNATQTAALLPWNNNMVVLVSIYEKWTQTTGLLPLAIFNGSVIGQRFFSPSIQQV
jgi:hypothetical protein